MRFKVNKIGALGEFDATYGQRYWGTVHDSDMAVSFNLMNPVDIPDGAEIEFEERLIKETGPNSKKPGTEYLFLKKVRVLGGLSPTNSLGIPPPPSQKLLELIYEDTQAILKLVDKSAPKTLKEAWDKTTAKDEVVDLDPSEEINLEDIGF